MTGLPAIWQEAFRRDAESGKPLLADPLPERRLARLLAAFIAAGLLFLVVPGTLLGVWNLIGISSHQDAESVSRVWIQAHGHAQLFGWVGTFMIGISLYALPKFRGVWIRSLATGWGMWALWTAALTARWASAIWSWRWGLVWPLSAAAELVVGLLLLWQVTAASPARRPTELSQKLIFAGLGGLIATLCLQLVLALRISEPVVPAAQNDLLLYLALWTFCFPVVWGFSSRFLRSFLGLARPDEKTAYGGLGLLAAGALCRVAQTFLSVFFSQLLALTAVAAACWSMKVFHPGERPAKVIGVDPRYPWFARAAFGWLVLSASLAVAGASPGLTGASRHAFTVGFLATLILAIGPRILPAFLNSRELWSKHLMLLSLAALTLGCTLRVVSEPLAYAGLFPGAWSLLPVSALTELTAVLLFAVNIGMTLLSPMPAWLEPRVVNENLTLYWCVSSYPQTRRLLVEAGLVTLGRAKTIPRSLTLREAAQADRIDWQPLLAVLREYFNRRLARALRERQPGGLSR